jgi:PIN domain nuclease of toxin-antitoxin system
LSVVLDASALLAALLGEPGADRVDAVIDGAMMSTVNLAEVVGHLAKAGADRSSVVAILAGLPINHVPPDETLAMEAGLLRRVGEAYGLSMGDRFCIAQARRLGLTALTADRVWLRAAGPLDFRVELIR